MILKNCAIVQTSEICLTNRIVWFKIINVGVDDAEGTPVPISNTVVKLGGAKDT